MCVQDNDSRYYRVENHVKLLPKNIFASVPDMLASDVIIRQKCLLGNNLVTKNKVEYFIRVIHALEIKKLMNVKQT